LAFYFFLKIDNPEKNILHDSRKCIINEKIVFVSSANVRQILISFSQNTTIYVS
jgi:hypothetical protein